MDPLTLPPGIERFITCVIDRARDELLKIDPAYVQRMEDVARLDAAGLVHPAAQGDRLPQPSRRLNPEWHRTLESVLDFYSAIDRIELNTKLLAEDSPDPARFPVSVLVNYHLSNWWPNAQAMIEKAGKLVKLVLRRSGMPRSDSRPLEDSLMSEWS